MTPKFAISVKKPIRSQRAGHFVEYGSFSKWGNESGIYWIRNKANDMLYIGSTTTIASRLSKHFSQLRKGNHPNNKMLEDFKKYGQENFEFGVYELTKDNLFEKEKEYQLKVDSSKLYNLQIKDTLRSASQINAAKTANKDVYRTEEYRNKMKKLKSNRIGRIDEATGMLVETFENSDEVCTKYDIAKSTLLGCCNGSKKRAKGFIWRYLDADDNILVQGKGKRRDIIQGEDIV